MMGMIRIEFPSSASFIHLGFLHIGRLVVHRVHCRARRADHAEHANRLVCRLESLAEIAPNDKACDHCAENDNLIKCKGAVSVLCTESFLKTAKLTIAKAEMNVKLSLTKRYAASESGV